MINESFEPQVRETWEKAQKQIAAECGEDKNKLALAELLGLRKLAMSIMSKRIMCDMAATKLSNRKLTR